jgi:lysophospholipase L1-like esterase
MLGTLVCAALLALPGVASAAPKRELYVSLGDSYASGWQATGPGQGRNTTNGFAYQVPRQARERGYRLQLVNFACGGATTGSLLTQTEPCSRRARAVGGRTWGGRTQLQAAERFLRARRDRIALVTVSIGGNDVTACAREADFVPCVGTAAKALEEGVARIARRLRRAAGPKVRIVGITYPDVILGAWVGESPNQKLASLSTIAFRSIINPVLERAYRKAGGRLVDVTTATGAYTPLDQTVADPTYGTIPVAVARVCELTYYCTYRDIHMTTPGYRIIAELVAGSLPRRRAAG